MANTALITGSTGGLGSCFVEIHAKRGGDLILVGRGQEALDKQAAEVSAKYGVTTTSGTATGSSSASSARLRQASSS